MNFWKTIGGFLGGGLIPGFENMKQERAQDDAKKLMNEQMKAYREQTELTRNELNRKQAETQAEKRRVEEKQIRALRRNYRAGGLLGVGNATQQDMSPKLGG